MAETSTHDVSVALFGYMCQNIVGTEGQVKTIRILNTIRDHLHSSKKFTVITSGSFGEGLDMRGSDVDQMNVLSCIEVTEDANINFIAGTIYFIMASDDLPPGFTKLRLLHSNDQGIFENCDFRHGYYFSNASIKHRFLSNNLSIVHGPCLSDNKGIYDLAVCVHCKSWIKQATKWIIRSKNGWPDNDLKQSITKHGVLFVPVGVKGSKNEELQWRISFSIGEKLLTYTLTHTQLLCYALMKILLKDVIDIDLQCKDLLCSYFIKTTLFWLSEELSTSIWKPENLISCFMRCLRRLIYYVEYSVCPHYFIPKINLFQDKIKGQSQAILLNKLLILKGYHWQCIMFSDQLSNICDLSFTFWMKPNAFPVFSVKQLVSSFWNTANIYTMPRDFLIKKVICKVLTTKSSKIKYLYAYCLSKYSCSRIDLLPLEEKFDNKTTYKQYNTIVSTILLSSRHDAVSGWLLLASFFYRTKEYKTSIKILQYCLLKCTPDKLYAGMNLSLIHKELYNLNVFMEMSAVQLSKFVFLSPVKLCSDSILVPDEFRIKAEDNDHIIVPVQYIHFLRFLCHHHLNNIRQCRDSLRDLKLTIQENYLISNPFQKALSYNLLGILFQLIGNTESARKAFIRSIVLFPDATVNCAFRGLSLVC